MGPLLFIACVSDGGVGVGVGDEGFLEALVDVVMKVNHPFHKVFAGVEAWWGYFHELFEMASAFFAGECFGKGDQELHVALADFGRDTEWVCRGHTVEEDPCPFPP